MSCSKAGRGVGHGEGRGGTNKSKLGRVRSERLSPQAQITCNRCQKPGHVRLNCGERQCFECQVWGHEAVSCLSKVPTPKKNGEKKKKDGSAVMAVDQEPDSEETAQTKVDEIYGGDKTCFMTVEIEKNVPPVGELPPETTFETWVSDSGCSQFVRPSADYMVNYRNGGGAVRIADDSARPVKGIGDLSMSFWSGKNWVQVISPNIARVPLMGYNLLC